LRTYNGVLTDEDADGQVEFAPEAGISGVSIWVVVDLASEDGVSAVATKGLAGPLPEEAKVQRLSKST
jgi:hypothetical protein